MSRRLIEDLGDVVRPARGANRLVDIACSIPHLTVATVFDVGAHIGESTDYFLAGFPKARIWAFEPVADTYTELVRRVGGHPRVTTTQVGFADEPGRASIRFGDSSNLASIGASGDETVTLTTIDSFCADHDVGRIDYLKVDTEGYDLRVLEGAENTLTRGAAALIEVEAGVNPENTTHVPLEVLTHFLEGHGYRLFGFYDQAAEWPKNRPNLRRVNPVFMSGELIAGGQPLRLRTAGPTRIRASIGIRWRAARRSLHQMTSAR